MIVAHNADAFRHLFLDSLRSMLSPEQAGAFILVLANSLQDAGLNASLKHELGVNFELLQHKVRQHAIDSTEDDLGVFKSIEAIGVGSLSCWRLHHAGDWELVYNPMRALRPARASGEVIDSIMQAFDPGRFNFNKPFLRPEILSEDSWRGSRLRVLYNKFPFMPYHLIIVPDPEMLLPQYLTAEYHGMMWELVDQQQAALPGFATGYNSLGACASVNQLHFQSFVREQQLPIERQKWKHNGGGDQYPLNCSTFNSVTGSWKLIDQYHRNNQPYNLLYRPGRCYVIARVRQGSDGVAARVRGAGWIEQCGVFNVSEQSDLESVSADEISDCLRSLSVTG